jgi:hypothetical protein
MIPENEFTRLHLKDKTLYLGAVKLRNMGTPTDNIILMDSYDAYIIGGLLG